jgi:hypothetical protein
MMSDEQKKEQELEELETALRKPRWSIPQPTPAEAQAMLDKAKITLEGLAPEEREQRAIGEALEELKRQPTVRQRVDIASFVPLEFLEKLRQHNPELMEPIIKGVEKRPARLEKMEKAIERLHRKRSEDSSQQQR